MASDTIKSWRSASEEEVRELARAWADDADEENGDVQQTVVMMNFTALARIQWAFILEAIALARTEDQLGALAAGPMEHLLGHHGDDYIALFEKHAAEDAKFAVAVRGMWQYKISDENWRRIEAIRRRSVQ
jgi:hypothetical protein